YDGSFYGLLPLDDTAVLAYGLRGHAYRSPDFGATWERLAIDAPVLLASAVKTRSGVVFLAGQTRTLFRSDDGGLTFVALREHVPGAIAELIEAPDGSILAFGEMGVARLAAPPSPQSHDVPRPPNASAAP
ncbi:MAG TPA: hypothetical protein VEQ65_10450, partial [Opitutus sp.]|nr:hypothetical protein [Opitutus sp.]